MKLLEKLLLPFPATLLEDILEISNPPELAMIKLDCLRKTQEEADSDPALCLSQQELDNYNSLKYEKRRIEWLGGRLAAKKALLEHLSIPITRENMREWPVAADKNGRPFFNSAQNPEISLSISHSHGLALAMVVHGRSCGLDVQKVSSATIRVKEKFCIDREEKKLDNTLSFLQKDVSSRLTLLWSAKESLRKALSGHPLTGFLAMQLSKVEPIDKDCWVFTLLAEDNPHQIMVFKYQDYAVAMCTA